MDKRELEKLENDDMIEELSQISKQVRAEMRLRARLELDDYVKELLK